MAGKKREDYSGAFKEAAQKARAIIAEKLKSREGMQKRLAALDAEIAKLRGVIELAKGTDTVAAKAPVQIPPPSMKEMIQVGEAYVAIKQKLAGHPDGIKHLGLHAMITKNGKPEYGVSTIYKNLLKGIERGEFEKKGIKYFLKAQQ